MATPCRAFIIDDDEDMVFLVAAAIEFANHGLEVAGTASSGDEALARLPEARPDVIVLDFRMPDRNGLEVAADILERDPEQNIVLFSAYVNDDVIAAAERVGIRECVLKDQFRGLPDILRRYCPAA